LITYIIASVELFIFLLFLLRSTLEKVIKASFLKNSFDFFITYSATRVKVELYGSIENNWILRNDSNLRAEVVYVNLTNFSSINLNTT